MEEDPRDIKKRIEKIRAIKSYEDLNIFCPVCKIKMQSGTERLEHMRQHVTPETSALIERVTSLPADDFYTFCLQEGFDIDGLGPKHSTVVNALATWMRYAKSG